jgi:hypothetical protein
MKPIWYFVGLLLLSMGVIITASGLYAFVNPPEQQKALSHLHPDIWWGLVMSAGGLLFFLSNRNKTVQ